jgi:hypothetical protein
MSDNQQLTQETMLAQFSQQAELNENNRQKLDSLAEQNHALLQQISAMQQMLLEQRTLGNNTPTQTMEQSFTAGSQQTPVLIERPNERPSNAKLARIPDPSKYDGTREGILCLRWIDEVTIALNQHRKRGSFLDDLEEVYWATSFLTNRASDIWKVERIEAQRAGSQLDIPFLFSVMRANCMDFHHQEKIRARYMSVKQVKSTQDFAIELLDLTNMLETRPSDLEILERFKQGLMPHVHERLSLTVDKPTNLLEYIRYCSRLDLEWYKMHGRTNVKHSYNAMYARPARQSGEWSARCLKEERCFNCGNLGHQTRTCRLKKVTDGVFPEIQGKDNDRL